MARIALATCSEFPDLYEDDRPLIDALQRRGASVGPAVWDDSREDWRSYDLVVLRSCWDYHLKEREFLSWLTDLEMFSVQVYNPLGVVRNNLHKSYLLDLEAGGCSIVPTRLARRGDVISLADVMDEMGWSNCVIKPAISLSAHNTFHVTGDAAERMQGVLERMLQQGDVLLQQFMTAVVEGEISLVFLDNEFSHAVCKEPAAGDFRVQSDHGGRTRLIDAGERVRREARAALETVEGDLLYARVDGVEEAGRLFVMELELIDPECFLSLRPSAYDDFADAIMMRV